MTTTSEIVWAVFVLLMLVSVGLIVRERRRIRRLSAALADYRRRLR